MNLKIKKADTLLILVVAVIAFGLVAYRYATRQEGAVVVVRVGSGDAARVIAELPLTEDIEQPIETEEEGYNLLVIKDGCAHVTEANCPDKICVKSYAGGICYDGETIVCLPHKLVVSIRGGETADVDHVVH